MVGHLKKKKIYNYPSDAILNGALVKGKFFDEELAREGR